MANGPNTELRQVRRGERRQQLGVDDLRRDHGSVAVEPESSEPVGDIHPTFPAAIQQRASIPA